MGLELAQVLRRVVDNTNIGYVHGCRVLETAPAQKENVLFLSSREIQFPPLPFQKLADPVVLTGMNCET